MSEKMAKRYRKLEARVNALERKTDPLQKPKDNSGLFNYLKSKFPERR